MLLRPGMTVLEGRNGCRREEWIAHWRDKRGEHLTIIYPGNLLAVQTENGFQHVMPGAE